jgi:hypothetical protein
MINAFYRRNVRAAACAGALLVARVISSHSAGLIERIALLHPVGAVRLTLFALPRCAAAGAGSFLAAGDACG